MDFYPMIFKRKSFHRFIEPETVTEEELEDLRSFLREITPLYSEIQTEIRIVKEEDTTCKRGAEYCVLFYSEPKGEYLRNIGYIGEQVDLYLTSKNIGTLWFGIGRPKGKAPEGMEYCIMIAIAKMPAAGFRKDMFKSKRKSLEETWEGEKLPLTDIVRFSPSACNSQPWLTVNEGTSLTVYRYKRSGVRGIMPKLMVSYYNRIDLGIYLFILETCLAHENYSWKRELYRDDSEEEDKRIRVARYTLQ